MNFLIALGVSNCAKARELLVSDFSFDDFGVVCPRPFVRKCNDCVVVASGTPETTQENDDIILWDGAVIDGETAFCTIMPCLDASKRMGRYVSHVSQKKEPRGYSGVYGCARVSSDGSCVIVPDQLSQYAFFYLRDGGRHLISNSLHLIEKTASLLGFGVSRDFASNAYEAAFGAGGWCRTGLSGVRKLPPNHFLVGRGRDIQFVPFSWSVFSQQPSSKSYQTNIESAAASLKTSATALSKAYPDQGLILDLSGGKDTRLLLGAQLAANEGSFQVFVGGQPGDADQEAAMRLVHHYDLDSVYFPSNIGADENLSPLEVARRSVYRNMGTSNLYQSDVGSHMLSGVAKIRGGSSEGRTKSFFVYPSGKKARKVLRYARFLANGQTDIGRWSRKIVERLPQRQMQKKLLTAMILSRGRRGHHLFRREFMRQAQKSVFSNIDWLEKQGVAPENLADTYYVFDRGWRHCGFPVQVMNTARPTFEPFNNIFLLKSQFSLTVKDRQEARVAFDLFERFNVPDLVEIPFENSDWPNEFFSQERRNLRTELSKISTDPMKPRRIVGPSGRADSIHTMGRVKYVREVQDYMLELASSLPVNHQCWDYLRRNAVLESISSGAFAADQFASLGVRLLHGFIWMSRDESRYAISSH